MEENKKSFATTIVTILSVVIVILVLIFLFYYYFANSTPAASTSAGPAQPALKNVALTSVINFAPPQTLPATQKNGNCFSSSVAAPFRQDAFRCMVDNSIYDPCFIVSEKGFVYCQEGIDASTGFLMKLTQDLPVVTPGVTVQTNWAWFLTLEDGTECSPFTGTRPIFNPGPNAQVAYYGCKSNDASQQIVLLGDLTQGNTWTANEAILTKTGGSGPWAIKSTKKVNITTVWQ